MPDETATIAKVGERLGDISVKADVEITPDTEIYEDLGISGDDLYDFICWLRQEFNVDFSEMQLSLYAPGEGGLTLLEMITGLGRATYRPLPLRKILAAIKVGSWRD